MQVLNSEGKEGQKAARSRAIAWQTSPLHIGCAQPNKDRTKKTWHKNVMFSKQIHPLTCSWEQENEDEDEGFFRGVRKRDTIAGELQR